MTTLKLAGLTWTVLSPSLLEYHGARIGFNGLCWRVGDPDQWDTTLAFPGRREAALAVLAALQPT